VTAIGLAAQARGDTAVSDALTAAIGRLQGRERTEHLGGRKNDGKRAMANVDRTRVLLRITWPPLYVDESGLPDNDDR
jgi:hypothetical protein